MPRSTTDELCDLDSRLIGDVGKLRYRRYRPLAIESGKGCRLRDVEGKEYLAFAATIANLGHSHPRIKQAIIEELNRSTFRGLIQYINKPSLQLAERLIALTPGNFAKKVWFGLSGSEASEIVARLLPLATGKRRLLSFIGSYHGSTDTSMAMSGHRAHARFISGVNITRAPYPNPYRCPFGDDVGAEACSNKAIRFIEDYLFKTICPPEDTAGIIVEVIQSDGGEIVPPPNFLPQLEQLCRRHNMYLIIDDVKIGLGRTGKMFSFEHTGVTPDIVILGKSLGGGLPIGAIVGPQSFLDVGLGLATFTEAGYALGCAAGVATLQVIEEEGLVENAAGVGGYLHSKLAELQTRHPLIGYVRGLGLVQGVELVRDRVTKEPANKEALKVVRRCYELGLLLSCNGAFANVLELIPPIILTKSEVDEGVQILDQALTDVEAGRVDDEKIARAMNS